MQFKKVFYLNNFIFITINSGLTFLDHTDLERTF